MARYKRFTFLCDPDERRILAALAKRLERSQSDSVRWLIRNAAAELQPAGSCVVCGMPAGDRGACPEHLQMLERIELEAERKNAQEGSHARQA